MKKVIISLFALAGLGLSVAMPVNAKSQAVNKGKQGSTPPPTQQHQGQYEVFSRKTKHSSWKSEGTYQSKDEALAAVHKLHNKGLFAVYEHH
jgi:hypothetical protein